MTTFDMATTTRFSRRTMIKGVTAAGLGLTLANAALLRSVAAQSESVTDIVNIAATAESLAVTLVGSAIQSATQGKYNQAIPQPVVNIVEAVLATEEFHLEFLQSAGAKPLTQEFTVPDPALLTDTTTLFTTVVKLETAFIAAYTAAMAEFAALKKPDLVKVAYQIGATEAEHRVLANYALGVRPANDVAFEAKQFATVGDAATALKQLGFIGGTGTAVSYPGPIDPAQFKSKVTETTPGGPAVSCVAMTMPDTGAGTMAGTLDGHHDLDQMLGLFALFGVGGGTLFALSRRLAHRDSDRANA